MVDVATRTPVWRALSELYLDTEHDAAGYRWIAGQLAASPYTLDELHEIDRTEVAPVCGFNLTVPVGGEWAGFDCEWLDRCCAAQARLVERRRSRGGHRVFRWLRDQFHPAPDHGEWPRLGPLIAELRAAGPRGAVPADGPGS